MRKLPSQLPFAASHLYQDDDQEDDKEDIADDDDDDDGEEDDDEDDADVHHLAEPGEVPAHHNLSGFWKERQNIRAALSVLQCNLQDRSVLVAAHLVVIIVMMMIMINHLFHCCCLLSSS